MLTNISPIQVQRYVSRLKFPITKESLVEKVKESGADKSIISTLEKIPDQSFDSPEEVSNAIGFQH